MFIPGTDTVRFVDIIRKELYTVALVTGPSSVQVLALPESVGCTFDIPSDPSTLLVGAKRGPAYLHLPTCTLTYISSPSQLWTEQTEQDPADAKSQRMRANDGAIDPQGRFWVTMMNDQLVKSPSPEGAVFVLHLDGSLRRAISDVTIPNGMAWNFAGDTMYFVDSTAKTIWAHDFDGSDGSISDRRAWWTIPESYPSEAVPDGVCQDVGGDVWVAIHGGGRVVRLRDDGKGKADVVGEVTLPTRCPTAPRIVRGGQLVVTTSEEADPDRFPESVEFAGAVFKVDVGVEGREVGTWARGPP